MRVILKDEVSTLGTIGDIVKVKRGYARNYLIPQGKAVEATQGNVNQHEAERASWEKKLEALKNDAESVKGKLEKVTLSFERKAAQTEDQKLFGSVTPMDIEAALIEQGFEADRRKFVIDKAIKTLGDHTFKVKLHKDIAAEVKLTVTRLVDEEAEAEAAAEAAAIEAAKAAQAEPEAATEEATEETAAEAAQAEETAEAAPEEAPTEEAPATEEEATTEEAPATEEAAPEAEAASDDDSEKSE